MHWLRLEGVNPTLHERYISEEVTGDWLGVHPPLFVLPTPPLGVDSENTGTIDGLKATAFEGGS